MAGLTFKYQFLVVEFINDATKGASNGADGCAGGGNGADSAENGKSGDSENAKWSADYDFCECTEKGHFLILQ